MRAKIRHWSDGFHVEDEIDFSLLEAQYVLRSVAGHRGDPIASNCPRSVCGSGLVDSRTRIRLFRPDCRTCLDAWVFPWVWLIARACVRARAGLSCKLSLNGNGWGLL